MDLPLDSKRLYQDPYTKKADSHKKAFLYMRTESRIGTCTEVGEDVPNWPDVPGCEQDGVHSWNNIFQPKKGPGLLRKLYFRTTAILFQRCGPRNPWIQIQE